MKGTGSKFILGIVVSFITSLSWAGGTNGAVEVLDIRVDKSGKGLIAFVSNLTNQPACGSGSTWSRQRLSVDSTTPGGRAALALALTAEATGQKVQATGTGTCDDYATVESWNYGYLRD